jgi:endonuclease YncB( thermonuclease family)
VAAEDQLEGYVRAVQGDTLDARHAGVRIGIGIIGVKAPSLNAPCGRQAVAFTQDLVSDGVRLVEEPGLTVDRRKRRMYHVMTLDGLSIAEELVSAGLATADGQGANRDRLAELQADARDARRGCLWGGAE